MTDDCGRLILAPHLGSWPPLGQAPPGPRFYLSWPGWEDFLTKRLGRASGPGSPLMLPDDPEGLTLAALDQLADRAGRQGAGLWPLLVPPAESSSSLAQAIRRGALAGSPVPQPLLSDRAYLALWTLNESRTASGRELLAEAARKERAMWAALRGEETAPPPPTAADPAGVPAGPPGRRTAYAWLSWRRLAAPWLRPGDLILPTAPQEEPE